MIQNIIIIITILLAVTLSLQIESFLIITNIILSLLEIIKHILFIGVNFYQIIRLITLNFIKFIFRVYIILILIQLWKITVQRNPIHLDQ